jgi:ABC-type sugar transport system substrate-binding protein
MRKIFSHTLAWLLAVATAGLGLVALTVPAGSANAAPASKPTVYWLEIGAGNPYWTTQHLAATTYFNKAGIKFKAFGVANETATDQASMLKEEAAQKPALIMVNAIDPATLAPSMKYAESLGVPVLELYACVPQATACFLYNETTVGVWAAKEAAYILKQRYGKVTGTVALLAGTQGEPQSDLRADGFTNYVKAHMPGVKTVDVEWTNWLASDASSTMQDWLTKYPDLSLVYGSSDTISVPAAEVAQRESRLCMNEPGKSWTTNPSCVVFVSADGFYLSYDTNGTLFSDEMYGPQWFGYVAAEAAAKIIRHQPYPKTDSVNPLFVTEKNAACVLRMQEDMANHMSTFNFTFGPTLQDLAAHFGCPPVTPGSAL